MMTRRELDFARARIDDFRSGADGPDIRAVAELAELAESLLSEVERHRLTGSAVEHQVALTVLLGETRAALAASHAGMDPAPWLEGALKPYGGVPAGAVPEQLAADAAGLSAAVAR